MVELEKLFAALQAELALKEKLIARLRERIVKLQRRIDYLECQLDID